MTSSMIAGEKKWASARRSGMTVLGKVAVPKPLNLPSQKLENHGLDPNVEIVPKGTLSWGSQASSAPNAWGSSSVSPNADGSTGSPSHLSGRPSSGSGTRPSTAGSDRAQDSTPSVWGTSSRPSSASGPLASNQTTLSSLRPRSAETRPGSSQLSRFAEPHSSDNSPAWGPNGSSNKLGLMPSNNDGFSLSSGDFPTLGSEKDSPGKNIDSLEHGYDSRPGSSSSRPASGKEKTITFSVGNVKGEPPNTWTRDGSQLTEHALHPAPDRWQGDMPPGAHPHRPPQHFDAWHGPPMNPPPGGWYRGPPRGPPYGAPLHPSTFPMEPFPFYRPQMPPNSSQQVHHPKNGELSRPQFPEGYIHPHPRMPMNPGFYRAPVPYEGFYGPPMGYHNHNERDMPFMGMPPGPPMYNRPPYENAIDPRPRKPSIPERMEPRFGHSDDTRGQYKVLLKQSHNLDEKRAEQWDHGAPSNKKNEWGLEDDQGTYPLGNESTNESKFSKQPQVLSGSPKASALIQKIDDINAKARNFDGRPDVTTLSCIGDQYNQSHASGMAAPARRPSQGAQGRGDHRDKRFNNQDVDGWRKKPLVGESSAEVLVMNVETSSNVLERDRTYISKESGKHEVRIQGKDEGDDSTLVVDESDSLLQRAKMREIAKQRAEKLQKEEEERTREQKAKALAKLEELNQRSHIADKAPPSGTVYLEEEKSLKSIECKSDSAEAKSSSSAVVPTRKDQIIASNSIMVGENTIVFDQSNCEAAYQLSDGSAYKHKQAEFKQKQCVNPAKGVLGKPVITQTGQSNFKAANDAARSENIDIEVASSGEPSLVTSSNAITESSTQHKKKNSRNSKNKHKVDEVAHVSVVPKVSTEKHEQNTNLPHSKVIAKHSIKDLDQNSSLSEETNVKASLHQWKPQPSRRLPRNQQGIEGEKSHSESVTWAPVRSHNKTNPMDKLGDSADPAIDTTNAKVDTGVQNNMKTKRAEIERYRPKPVAKELAQNIETTQHGDSAVADMGPTSESKNWDNKPSKARGSWKQRVHVESAPNQGLQEVGKQELPLKSDVISSKVQTTDGWNSVDDSDTSATKAQVPSRGTRHPYNSNRDTGNSFEFDHGANQEPSPESAPAPKMNQMDKHTLKENRFGGERMSQWQPKTQVYPVYNRRNRPTEGQMGADAPASKNQSDKSLFEQVNVVPQDPKREKNQASSSRGGRPHSPNLGPGNITSESEIAYAKNDQQFPSGFRKNANHINRFGRGHEPQRDVPFNRERPRQNPHFEYQPVGQYGNSNKQNNLDVGSSEGSHNVGPKYRERNQGYQRRGGGNFYGRQSGVVHGEARYD